MNPIATKIIKITNTPHNTVIYFEGLEYYYECTFDARRALEIDFDEMSMELELEYLPTKVKKATLKFFVSIDITKANLTKEQVEFFISKGYKKMENTKEHTRILYKNETIEVVNDTINVFEITEIAMQCLNSKWSFPNDFQFEYCCDDNEKWYWEVKINYVNTPF